MAAIASAFPAWARNIAALPLTHHEPGPAVTVDELIARESIRQTMARYNMAGDRLRSEDFLAVFTDDAVLETERVPEADAFRCEGREAIAQWFGRWGSRDREATAQRATFIRHHLSTSQIEFSATDTARARTYWVAYSDIGPDHCGYYVDVFRKAGEQWLIAHRKVRLDWRAPQSLYQTAIATL
jgi:3-phenylpropionate/cinnamic acid dioxygenase small subunit